MLIAFALLAKLVLYLGALVTIGVLSHFCLSIQPSLKWLRVSVGALTIGAITKLFAANAQLAGALKEIFNQDTFGWVWQSNGTQFIFFLSGGILAITASVFSAPLFKKVMSLFSILIIAAGFAASGHTQGAENMPLLPLWVVPHILIAGFWIWAPVSLWPHSLLTDKSLSVRTDRFSLIAVWAVPLIFVSGVYLFWRLNGDLFDGISTLYGRLLAIKLGAALIILGVGALNKFRISKRLRHSPSTGRNALRNSLSVEAVLFAVVLISILIATTVTGPTGHFH